jgi:NitT/TauT family transport system substrate-binding protein
MVIAAMSLQLACTAAGTSPTLKVGLLPLLETLPVWVGIQEGHFQAEGLHVEPILFASAVERDAALQTKQIDGELTDLVSAALLNKDTTNVKVVRTAFVATPEMAMISLLVPSKSDTGSLAGLKGKQIGISHNSVMEYVADQLLIAGGVNPSEVQKVEVSKIPVRLEMLSQGQIDGAVLPEPLASLARKQGARLLADDRQGKYGQSVWVMRQELLTERPGTVRAFLKAYEKATNAIANSPEQYRSLLITKANLPEPIKDTFGIPRLPEASVPSRSDTLNVVRWMVEHKLLDKPLDYEQVVDMAFLPAR